MKEITPETIAGILWRDFHKTLSLKEMISRLRNGSKRHLTFDHGIRLENPEEAKEGKEYEEKIIEALRKFN